MKKLAAILALASLVSAAPLDIFAPLIDGQWNSVARFPDGQEIRSRTVWLWGADKQTVRMRRFVLGKEGEVERYQTVLFHDAKNKQIAYRVFTAAGSSARGVAFVKDGEVILEQAATKTFPGMRNGFRVGAEKKKCTTRTWLHGKQGWKLRGESASVREKLTPAKKLPVGGDANPLAGLEPISKLKGWKWSMHKRLLYGPSFRSGEVYISFEPKGGVLLFLYVKEKGGVTEGTVKIETKTRFVFNHSKTKRTVAEVESPEKHAVWDERKGDSGWEKIK